MVISDQVHIFILRFIINYLMQPYNIWMFKSLQNFHFFKYWLVCIFAISHYFSFQKFLIHLLNCILNTCYCIHAKLDFTKTSFSNCFNYFIIINKYFFSFSFEFFTLNNIIEWRRLSFCRRHNIIPVWTSSRKWVISTNFIVITILL